MAAARDPFAVPHVEITVERDRCIGEGAFGAVYKGTYNRTTVAVKELKVQQLSERQQAEFMAEVAIMAQLRHPNIVEFYGYTATPPFAIVMEFLSHGSLYHVLHAADIEYSSLQRTLWAQDIAAGLAFLHARQIVHRDLKSQNVLVGGPELKCKLSDFGLAVFNLRTTTKTLSKTGAAGGGAVGSVRWMAPELFSLKNRYASASDVYALGMFPNVADSDYYLMLWEGSMVVAPLPTTC
jgi:serine/threonine protein kinase